MTDEINQTFTQIVNIIENAKENTFKKVNEELIQMYWNIGQYLSEESQSANFGDSI